MYKTGGFIAAGINGPTNLNSLNPQIVPYLNALMKKWDQDHFAKGISIRGMGFHAFSSGTDFKQVLNWTKAGEEQKAINYFQDLYQLMFTTAGMNKPVLCPINGLSVGASANGLALHAAYSTTTENTLVALTENDMGFFMDCGLAMIYSKFGPGVGMYHALTGAPLNGADLRSLGGARFTFRLAQFHEFEEEVAKEQSVEDLEGWFHAVDRTGSFVQTKYSLEDKVPVMERCFIKDSMAEVIKALEADEDPWANEVAEVLRKKSPLSLCITFEMMKIYRDHPEYWPFTQDLAYFESLGVHDIARKLQSLVNLDYNIKYDTAKQIDRGAPDEELQDFRMDQFAQYQDDGEHVLMYQDMLAKEERESTDANKGKKALDIEPGAVTDRPIIKTEEDLGLDVVDAKAGYLQTSPIETNAQAKRTLYRGTIPVVDPDELVVDPIIQEAVPSRREQIQAILRDKNVSEEEKNARLEEYFKLEREDDDVEKFMNLTILTEIFPQHEIRKENQTWLPAFEQAKKLNMKAMGEYGEDGTRPDPRAASLSNKAAARIISAEWGKEFYHKIKDDRPARNIALQRSVIRSICGAESMDYMKLQRKQLKLEILVTQRLLRMPQSDFREGMQATLIDKRRPKWSFAKIEDVPRSFLDTLFSPILQEGEKGLFLPDEPNSNHNWIDGAWRGYQLSTLQARDGWFKDYMERYHKALDLVTFGPNKDSPLYDPLLVGQIQPDENGIPKLTPEGLDYLAEYHVAPMMDLMSPEQLDKFNDPDWLEKAMNWHVEQSVHHDQMAALQIEVGERYDERALDFQQSPNVELSEPFVSEYQEMTEAQWLKPLFAKPRDMASALLDRNRQQEGETKDEWEARVKANAVDDMVFEMPLRPGGSIESEMQPLTEMYWTKPRLNQLKADASDVQDELREEGLEREEAEIAKLGSEPEDAIPLTHENISTAIRPSEKRNLEKMYQRGEGDRPITRQSGETWKNTSRDARRLAHDEAPDVWDYPPNHYKHRSRYDHNQDLAISNLLSYYLGDEHALMAYKEIETPGKASKMLDLMHTTQAKAAKADDEYQEEELEFEFKQKDYDELPYEERHMAIMDDFFKISPMDENDEPESEDKIQREVEESLKFDKLGEKPMKTVPDDFFEEDPMPLISDIESYDYTDKMMMPDLDAMNKKLGIKTDKPGPYDQVIEDGRAAAQKVMTQDRIVPSQVGQENVDFERDFDEVIDSFLIADSAYGTKKAELHELARSGGLQEPADDEDDFIEFDTEEIPVVHKRERFNMIDYTMIQNRMPEELEDWQKPL